MRQLVMAATAATLVLGLTACSAGGHPTPVQVPPLNINITDALPSSTTVGHEAVLNVTLTRQGSQTLTNKLQSTNTDAVRITGLQLPTADGVTVAAVNNSASCYNTHTNQGATLSAGQSCRVTLTVVGAQAGNSINTNATVLTNQGNVTIPVHTSFASPANPAATISVTNTPKLIADAKTSVTISNTSRIKLNNPRLVLASWLSVIATQQNIELRGDLAPGESHTFTFSLPGSSAVETALKNNQNAIDSNATLSDANAVLRVTAGNNDADIKPSLALSLEPASITGELSFSEQDTQAVTLSNQSNTALTINSVNTNSLPAGVSVVDDEKQTTSCVADVTLQPNQSCTVNLAAGASASGTGTLSITYSDTNNTSFTSTTNITVAGISLNAALTNGDLVIKPSQSEQPLKTDVTITNNGRFNWITTNNITIVANSTADTQPTGLTITAPSSGTNCLATTVLAAGQSCQIAIQANNAGNQITSTDYDLSLSGINLLNQPAILTFAVSGAWDVNVDDSTSQFYPAVQRIAVTNGEAASGIVSFPDLSANQASTDFELYNGSNGSTMKGPWCTPTRCPAATRCEENESLSEGQTCYIYLHAKQTVAVGAVRTTDFNVDVPGAHDLTLTNQGSLYVPFADSGNPSIGQTEFYRYNSSGWQRTLIVGSHTSAHGLYYGATHNGLGQTFLSGSTLDGDDLLGVVIEYNQPADGNAFWQAVTSSTYYGAINRLVSNEAGDLYAASVFTDGAVPDPFAQNDLDVIKGVETESGFTWSSIGGISADGLNPYFDIWANVGVLAADPNGKVYAGGLLPLNDEPSYIAQYNANLVEPDWEFLGSDKSVAGSVGSIAFTAAGVGYYSAVDSDGDAKVFSYDAGGNTWNQVGNAITGADLQTNVVIGPDNTLYWMVTVNEEVSVLRFNGTAWIPLGSPIEGSAIELDVDPAGHLILAVSNTASKAEVYRYNGTAWVNLCESFCNAEQLPTSLVSLDQLSISKANV